MKEKENLRPVIIATIFFVLCSIWLLPNSFRVLESSLLLIACILLLLFVGIMAHSSYLKVFVEPTKKRTKKEQKKASDRKNKGLHRGFVLGLILIVIIYRFVRITTQSGAINIQEQVLSFLSIVALGGMAVSFLIFWVFSFIYYFKNK